MLQSRALMLSDDNGVLLEHYGDILFHLGKSTEALDYWKRALDAGGGSDQLQEKVNTGNYSE